MCDEKNALTMGTTVDADIHTFEGDVDLIRMKADRNKWIKTVDGRFVRCSAIVSLWNPTKFEVDRYFEQIEGNEDFKMGANDD